LLNSAVFYENMVCINSIVNGTETNITCYTLFLTLVLSLQLELARLNYNNRKIETYERFLVMQNTLVKFEHRKIVFVIAESSVT